MVSLSEILDSRLVKLDVEAKSKDELLRSMTAWLVDAGLISEQDKIKLDERIAERERLGATCVGKEIAIPHSHLESLKTPLMGFARLKEPIDFGEPDHSSVNMVLLLITPSGDTLLQLMAISRICRVLRDDEFVADLRAAASPQDVEAAFRAVEARHLG